MSSGEESERVCRPLLPPWAPDITIVTDLQWKIRLIMLVGGLFEDLTVGETRGAIRTLLSLALLLVHAAVVGIMVGKREHCASGPCRAVCGIVCV